MRRLMFAAIVAAAGSLAGGSAQALPGAPVSGVAADNGLGQTVALVCRPVWNGWRWVEQCYHTGPRFIHRHRWHRHHHHHHHHRHHHHRHHHHRHH